MNLLTACATAAEAGDLIAADHLLTLGVGKSSAAASLAARLATELPDLLLLFGVCGAYPERHVTGKQSLRVGALCLLRDDLFADEGVASPRGFQSLAELGLGEVGPFAADPDLTGRAASLLGEVPVVRGATVSTGSGTESLSTVRAARTGALVETMEGAAVALVCQRFRVPLLHLRCVSNYCGDRDRGEWDLEAAAKRARSATLKVLEAFHD